MVARDDSVIRGSLIACLIFLVLSLALNFFFWRWGDTQAKETADYKGRLSDAQDGIRDLESQKITFKKMLGVEQFTEEEYDALATSNSGDADMDAIAQRFVQDMSYFGQDEDKSNRNYPKLPAYLINAIRSRNTDVKALRSEALTVRDQADNEVKNAKQAQADAEAEKDKKQKELEVATQDFAQERQRINKEREQDRDSMTKMSRDMQTFRKTAAIKEKLAMDQAVQLKNTIETQRQKLNELRSDRFETRQGEIRYVMTGGDVVTINLGSADALRPGVTFGVIDRDETRLQDAKIKASIQVTRIRGQHLAEARVVAKPSLDTPIIEGDYIYSPFWAPGRRVQIALAGDIDIDGDGRPDNQQLVGMIRAAGAEVAAQISSGGAIEGKLDSNIRFLVMGEAPEVSATSDDTSNTAAIVAAQGEIRARATELGLTIIPAWKLQAYLRTIDDTLTTPLGSAVRAEDFPPITAPGTQSRMPTDLPELYKRQTEGQQQDNNVLPP